MHRDCGCMRALVCAQTFDYLLLEVGNMKRSLIVIGAALVVTILIGAACSKTGSNNGNISRGKVIKTATAGNLTATLSNSTGQLKQGDQEVMLDFTDRSEEHTSELQSLT